MALDIPLSVYAIVGVTLAIWLSTLRPRPNRLPYPPGPKPLPLIGNVLDMPKKKAYEVYDRWSRQYGDIVHLTAFGSHIIVLNSEKAVNDLLERRSAVYSSRPHTVMLHELMGYDKWQFGLQPYGEAWRTGRRVFHAGVHQGVVHKYEPLQIQSARAFLKRLRADPNDLHSAVRDHIGSFIVDAVYGITEPKKQHELINLIEEVMELFGQGAEPGKFLVDIIPALRHVPSWVPGAGFQKLAARLQHLVTLARRPPYEEVKKAMTDGTAKPCMATWLMDEHDEGIASDGCHVAYGAGSDTSVSALLSFILTMCHYPDIQTKAQAELDSVVGLERLPNFGDRKRLPYLNALILEVLRWQPVAPMGLPHATSEVDEYDGYYIPKDSIVLGNVWSILHNPDSFPEPEEFRPERFLMKDAQDMLTVDHSVLNPTTIAFGFGRRVCPGRHMALNTLFATISSTLAAFNISPIVNATGKPVLPPIDMADGIVSHPVPFKCNIKPRSARAAELVDMPLPERGMV